MKISPVLPVALSSFLAVSLATPLRLRYPTPAEAEKRADTFLRPKAQSLDEVIHEKLDFGSGEPLLVRRAEVEKRAETLDQTEKTESTGAFYSSGGSHQTLAPHGNLDSAIHATLDFSGSGDPLLFKKDAGAAAEEKRDVSLPASSSSLDTSKNFDAAIHEALDFSGSSDPLFGTTSVFARAEKAIEGAAAKIARAFHA